MSDIIGLSRDGCKLSSQGIFIRIFGCDTEAGLLLLVMFEQRFIEQYPHRSDHIARLRNVSTWVHIVSFSKDTITVSVGLMNLEPRRTGHSPCQIKESRF